MLRAATIADAAAIAGIYNHHVLNTIVTFEEDAVTAADMAQRITEVSSSALPWLVWEENGVVLGYCYASKWKSRCAYRYSVEATVYLANGATRRGIGTQLYQALIAALKARGIHGILGGVSLPNPASVALHEKLGFVKVAHFKEVGWKFEKWIDVGYWELLL
jgi:L-amino acid N-acyltransferase YncA